MPRYVHLKDDFSIDEETWKSLFNTKTRAIILNTPNNSTGKVFTKKELAFIAERCINHKVIAFTYGIYKHILYDGRKHLPFGSLDGMHDLTVTIRSFSKT